MGKYDKLGLQASSSDRWLVCTASPHEIVARAAELNALKEEPKDYTIQGDEAHKLAELTLKAKTRGAKPLDDVRAQFPAFEAIYGHEPDNEQLDAVASYVKLVRSFEEKDTTTFIEVSAPLPYMPDRVCRLDSLIIGPKAIDLIDLKYGVGVSVEAEENSQLIINGMSALRYLESLDLYEVHDEMLVRLKVFQPRARDKRTIRQWNISVKELRDHYAVIHGVALQILAKADLKFAPSDDTCRFCPLNQPEAGITCAHRTGQMFGDLPAEIKKAVPVLNLPDTRTLPVEVLAQIVSAAPALKGFLEDCRKRAFGLLEGGNTVPGFKLVQGRSSRSWRDEERAKELLKQKVGINEYAPRSLVSPAAAEKLLKGKELSTKFKNLLAAEIVKAEGSPTMVEASDERPAIEIKISAADEFKEIDAANQSADASGGGVFD